VTQTPYPVRLARFSTAEGITTRFRADKEIQVGSTPESVLRHSTDEVSNTGRAYDSSEIPVGIGANESGVGNAAVRW
jgi:hypothetical protein